MSRPKRRYQTTTDSKHSDTRFPNRLPQVQAVKPDQVWQSDLTYVRVQDGFVYLACVMDSGTREIVGWAMSKFMDAPLPLTALRGALTARCPAPDLLRHSDQAGRPHTGAVLPKTGSHYASRLHLDRLKAMGITPSLSRTGNPYDNARMESFCKTLKTERVNAQDDVDLDDAREHMNHFIGTVYDRERLQSSLEYCSAR